MTNLAVLLGFFVFSSFMSYIQFLCIHLCRLVFGHKDNPARLPKCPRVVVISYTMLRRLRRNIVEQEWATLVVDESHNLRCTKKACENDEVQSPF